MEKAQELKIGLFGLSGLNTNVKFPCYQNLTKTIIKGRFPQSRVAKGACKYELDISK